MEKDQIFLKLFFASVFFIFFTNLISRKAKFILTSLMIIIPLLVINLNNDIKNRFGNQFYNYILNNGIMNFYYSSQYGAHFGTGLKIIQNYPLTGIGFKNFFDECAKKEYEDKKFLYSKSRCSTHPHQLHLDIASSVGIIGYLLLISSFIYLIILSFKSYSKSKNLYTLASLAFILFSLFLPLPSGSFFTSYSATIFGLTLVRF